MNLGFLEVAFFVPDLLSALMSFMIILIPVDKPNPAYNLFPLSQILLPLNFLVSMSNQIIHVLTKCVDYLANLKHFYNLY